MMSFCISAGIELTDPTKESLARKEMAKLVAETVKEPGCLKFEIRQNLENPSLFTLWEIWQTAEDLDRHFQYDHTKAYLAQDLTRVKYVEKLSLLAGA
ncbi:putative quinol monooxygenase [Terasakiella pusilla]|uniref:putative quinol monooxygenase n=2 Tax=Terasakiella pusilla TaxID=64973 RepID=UPI00048C0537